MENLVKDKKIKTDLNKLYNGKKVFVTGHTGFKGSWLVKMLLLAGADVTGYSLHPATTPSLYEIANISKDITSFYGDIRDYEHLKKAFNQTKPDIVFHLAAQPIVRESYKNPRLTYETNVMGTVNIFECARTVEGVKSIINITTDKVYKNNEWVWGYRETDPLDGYDPYSNSKSCSELVTSSYSNSFFHELGIPVSTARAGNVIGGGDFAKDRIIPDCIRAALESKTIEVRNPYSIRPYQHVLEAIKCYMLIAANQMVDSELAGNYNIGPDDTDCITTGKLVELFCQYWGEKIDWKDCSSPNQPHEASFLRLDCSRLKNIFSWKPTWNIGDAVEKTCSFTKEWMEGGNLSLIMEKQICDFIANEE